MAELNERGLQAAIRAVAELAYKDAKLKKVSVDQFRATLESSISEGDRSFGIVCHSLLEGFIRSAFSSHLFDLNKSNEKYIFGEYGLLSSATKITRLSYHLGWLSPGDLHSIGLLAKIRNRFAHESEVKTFDHKIVRSYLFSFDAKLLDRSRLAFEAARRVNIEDLEAHDKLISIDEVNDLLKNNCRYRYIIIFISTLLDITMHLTFQPVAQRFATDVSIVRDIDLADKGLLAVSCG